MAKKRQQNNAGNRFRRTFRPHSLNQPHSLDKTAVGTIWDAGPRQTVPRRPVPRRTVPARRVRVEQFRAEQFRAMSPPRRGGLLSFFARNRGLRGPLYSHFAATSEPAQPFRQAETRRQAVPGTLAELKIGCARDDSATTPARATRHHSRHDSNIRALTTKRLESG